MAARCQNTSIALFAKILDESPDYVENTLLPFLRFKMRKLDPEPLERGQLRSSAWRENTRNTSCTVPTLARPAVHIRYAFRTEFITLFPFDT